MIESVPVSEAIKTGRPEREAHLAAGEESLPDCVAEGIRLIRSKVMTVLVWTRTSPRHRRPKRARAQCHDLPDFEAFDIHVPVRPNAAQGYSRDVLSVAAGRAAVWDAAARVMLSGSILAGLPGSAERGMLDDVCARRAPRDRITEDGLRAIRERFRCRVVPVAGQLGVRLCGQPNGLSWEIFGLPHILPTEAGHRWLLDVVPSPANGFTVCTGRLGARGDNDAAGMVPRPGPQIHFLHLHTVRREGGVTRCPFFEDDHPGDSTDRVAVIRAKGHADRRIPMPPDHGLEIPTDAKRVGAPGSPAEGRRKGLADLRGAMLALQAVA